MNRPTSGSYSDGTPAVTYAYDSTTIANGKGHLASVSSSVSTYSYSGYDAAGKPLGGSQTLGAQTYALSYVYDLSGHVTSMTYPSGRVVNYNYDNAGRLGDKDATHLAFSGNLGDGTTRTYAKTISYGPGGQMTQEQFGTTTAIYNKLFYNSRGQLAEIREGTTPNNTDWERGAIINHYSNQSGCSGASCNATDNNGNLMRQEVKIPNSDTFAQFYEYDSLNRLQSVRENKNGGPTNWQQVYTYDRYGNRRIDTNPNQTWGGVNNLDFELETGTNRLYAPGDLALPDTSRRMRYDTAGNLKTDTYSGAAVTRAYDGENRMTSETQANSYVAGSYSYDGDGRRVKRILNGTETWQVYGLGGELLAEYAANGAAASPQKEYGYRNGQLLITTTVAAGWGSAPTLHDNPLVVAETTVQSRHITELREAIDALRAHLGMSAYSWQYSATTNDWISANPILEMRTALDQALGAPSGGYSAGLAQYQQIKASHIQELRDRVLAAWTSGSSTQINWLVSDQLGTPRMIFVQTGSFANMKRHDYLPFGEELFGGPPNQPGIGGRVTTQGYAADSVRQKFTQKERDNETGLDYFEARFYSSTQGRFTSADPIPITPDRQIDPQSLNLYSYVRNNPLAYTDPTGMERVRLGQHTDQVINQRVGEIDEALKDKDLTKKQINKLQSERKTLLLEQEGNKIGNAFLAALDKIGARNGLQLSNLSLSSTPVADRRELNGGKPLSAQTVKDLSDPYTVAYVARGVSNQIFILQPSLVYQGTLKGGLDYGGKIGRVLPSDLAIFGGTNLRHEQYHRDVGPSETRAYEVQRQVLNQFGPGAFANKEFYKFVRDNLGNNR